MQALAQYAELVYGGEVDMSIDISAAGLQHHFAVTSKNNLVLQRIQVRDRSLFVNQLGTGENRMDNTGMAWWLGRSTLVPRVEGSSYGPDLLQKV